MKKLITIVALLGLGASLNAMDPFGLHYGEDSETGEQVGESPLRSLGKVFTYVKNVVSPGGTSLNDELTGRQHSRDAVIGVWLSLPRETTKDEVKMFLKNNEEYGDFLNVKDSDGNTALDKLYMQRLDKDHPFCVYLKGLGVTSKEENKQGVLPVKRSLALELDAADENDNGEDGDLSDLDVTSLEEDGNNQFVQNTDLQESLSNNDESSEGEVLDGELSRVMNDGNQMPEAQLVLDEDPRNSFKKEQSYVNPITIGLAAIISAVSFEFIRRWYVSSHKEEATK